MSHFALIVELPADTLPADYDDKLGELLAPYDEDLAVPAYKNYWDEARPQDHWSFKHVYGEDAEPPCALDEITWAQFVVAYNERYRDDGERPALHDPERDRVYEVSTYNPKSKWDWWVVGGRWRGYFTARSELRVADSKRMLLSGPAWMNEGRELLDRSVDGGPIRFLDLAAQRERARLKAVEYADKYERLIVGTPEPLSWSDMLAVYDTVDEARERYREQPRVAATRELDGFFGSAIDDFKWGRELYIHRAELSAVPAYSYLTQDGEWLSPGDMGWFGMSSDTPETREAYDIEINKRISEADPDTVLIVVDCHI
jgi:hypothetical protein